MQYRVFLLVLFVTACANSPVAPDQAATTSTPAAAELKEPAANTAVKPAPAIPSSDAERTEQTAKAKTLRAQAIEIKQSAQTTYDAAQKSCWDRFLVSSCLDKARLAYRAEHSRARKMEREAKLIDRNLNRYDAAQKDAARAAENLRKDAEIRQRTEAR